VKFEVRAGALVLIPELLYGTHASISLLAVVLLSLLAHELGHILAASACHVRVKALGLCAWGAFVSREHGTPAQDVLISLSGPLVNFVLFVILGFAQQGVFAAVNLLLFAGNLLPVPGTDGWRAAQALHRQWCLYHPSPRLASFPNR
jgi:stage IV sporulation protein FB